MGFLHKLWDETLAGPAPESGLGKLRKYNSFSGSRSSSAADPPPPVAGVPVDDHVQIPISRSITILRSNPGTPRNLNVFSGDSGSVPSSPSASNTPTSPLSPGATGHGGHFKKLTRKKPNLSALHQGDPRSPTATHDSYWIVLSALDRT